MDTSGRRLERSTTAKKRPAPIIVPKFCKKKKWGSKRPSLLDHLEDPKRTNPIVGLEYVVELWNADSNKLFLDCKMCDVQGETTTILTHLYGFKHTKAYMSLHYNSVLQSFQRETSDKTKLSSMMRKFAETLESKESPIFKVIQLEDGNIITEFESSRVNAKGSVEKQPKEFERQAALTFSEKFKPSSYEEATLLYEITGILNKRLEYFWRSKRPFVKEKLEWKGASQTYEDCGRNSTSKYSVSKDSGKHSPSRDSSLQVKKHKYDETDGTPILSLPLPPYGTNTQQLFESEPVETISHFPFNTVPYNNSSSASNSFYGVPHPGQDAQYYSSLYTYNPYVNTPFLHVPQNQAIPSNTVTSPVEQFPAMFTDLAAHVQETPVTFAHTIPPEDVPFIGGSSETQASPHEETDTDEQEPAPSASSNEQCSETVSASHSSGKTSKALTPDVINLLKGKDVDTVIKILKTIAPFYPALQDVNIDMFAQVLFHTGALD